MGRGDPPRENLAREDPDRGDEQHFEEIGGGLIEDRPQASSARARPGDYDAGWLADGGASTEGNVGGLGRTAVKAWRALRTAAADFTRVQTWLGVGVALSVPAALAVAMGSWAVNADWLAEHFLVPVHLVLAAMLTVSAAIYGTVAGFGAWRARGARGAGGAVGAWAVRTVAFLVVAGFILFVLGAVGGASTATTVSAVVAILLELAIFGALGAGAVALAGGHAIGKTVAAASLVVLLGGNLALTWALAPAVWSTERASLPVNVDRDDAGRLVYYECIGSPERLQSVPRSERVAWIAASHPVVLFASLAAGTLPEGTEFGWMLDTPQWALDGPESLVPCLNGVESEEVPPSFPATLVGVLGQAGIALLLILPARWAARRRQAGLSDRRNQAGSHGE